MHRMQSLVCVLLILIAGAIQGKEWPYYAADAKSSKYAPLSQIDGDNFARLQEVWRFTVPDSAIAAAEDIWTRSNKGTPLVIDGVLYYGSPFNVLCAIDPTSGEGTVDLRPAVVEGSGRFLGLCARHRLLGKRR